MRKRRLHRCFGAWWLCSELLQWRVFEQDGVGARGWSRTAAAGMCVPRNPGLHRVQPVWCRGSGFTADFKPGHI